MSRVHAAEIHQDVRPGEARGLEGGVQPSLTQVDEHTEATWTNAAGTSEFYIRVEWEVDDQSYGMNDLPAETEFTILPFGVKPEIEQVGEDVEATWMNAPHTDDFAIQAEWEVDGTSHETQDLAAESESATLTGG